jgi:hypothetical protein
MKDWPERREGGRGRKRKRQNTTVPGCVSDSDMDHENVGMWVGDSGRTPQGLSGTALARLSIRRLLPPPKWDVGK